jgi:A/G-specific adenine glycosylase
VKTRRVKRGTRENALLVLLRQGPPAPAVWLVQRPPQGVWAGLWTPPLHEGTLALEAAVAGWPGQGEWLPTLQHALTHLDWTLHPLRWHWPEPSAQPAAEPPLAEGRWFAAADALALGLPAPVRKLLLALPGFDTAG